MSATPPVNALDAPVASSNVSDLVSQPYRYGFVTDIETEKIAKGLSEEVVRLISAKKKEPQFLSLIHI